MKIFLDTTKHPGQPIVSISFPESKMDQKQLIGYEIMKWNKCEWKVNYYGQLNPEPIKIEK